MHTFCPFNKLWVSISLMIILLSESCQWSVGTCLKGVSLWLTELSSERELNKAKRLIPVPWAQGSLSGHPYTQNPYTQTLTRSICEPDDKQALFLTFGAGVHNPKNAFQSRLALMYSLGINENRCLRRGLMMRPVNPGSTLRKQSEDLAIGGEGNLWASQEAATFLRLGLEKRRPLPLMPQTKEWSNLLVKNSSLELNQRPAVHTARPRALVLLF